MLTLVSKIVEWSPAAKRWMGLAGDIEAEQRLTRGDFANMRATKIESRISKSVEMLRYHMVEAEKFTGRERENHLEKVQLYLQYIRRMVPTKNETERTVANVWPWPQMMRAALNTEGEGGTSTFVSPSLAGMVTRAAETMLKDGPAPPPSLPEPTTDEVVEVDEVKEEVDVGQDDKEES